MGWAKSSTSRSELAYVGELTGILNMKDKRQTPRLRRDAKKAQIC